MGKSWQTREQETGLSSVCRALEEVMATSYSSLSDEGVAPPRATCFEVLVCGRNSDHGVTLTTLGRTRSQAGPFGRPAPLVQKEAMTMKQIRLGPTIYKAPLTGRLSTGRERPWQ